MRQLLERDGAYACIYFLDRNFSVNGIPNHEKYHNKYDSRLGYGELTVIFALYSRFKFIFCHCGIKKLAKIILYTKLFYKFVHAIIIAIIVRKYL